MSGQNFGALGMTFTVMRGMQAVCLIAIIGMTSNFIQEMVASAQSPHSVLVGTLSVVSNLPSSQPVRITNNSTQTCISVLYVAISYILYFDSILPLLIAAGLDSALLIAVIVVAVTTGKPLSYLNCAALSSKGGATASFMSSMGQNMKKDNYWVWTAASKATCYEMKAIWGLSIALCVLFAFSAICAGCMWKRQKNLGVKGQEIKDIEG